MSVAKKSLFHWQKHSITLTYYPNLIPIILVQYTLNRVNRYYRNKKAEVPEIWAFLKKKWPFLVMTI